MTNKKFHLYIGRDNSCPVRRVRIAIAWGYRPDAKINEIPWRHWWSWSMDMPKLIYRARRGKSPQVIGFCAFGRCRIFR